MQVGRYTSVLYLQCILLIADIIINSTAELLRLRNVVLLVVFVLQDIFLIFQIILMFLVFFNTHVLKAGLVSVLVKKFKLTMIITFLYFCLSVGLHIWTTSLRWERPNSYVWTMGYQALYGVHRSVSVFYYFFYKRTALHLSDKKYYENSAWLIEQFRLQTK